MTQRTFPQPRAVLTLLKPITWFAPMWAFGCGAVSSGLATEGRWLTIVAGIVLAGPLVCATSQAVNDWFDRHVDAINEPDRPIPSGRIPGTWGLFIGIGWTLMSMAVAYWIGIEVFWAACVGLAFAWAYSAPPLRFKQNGWLGNAAVGICYEGLPWLTGAMVMIGGTPGWEIFTIAGLYSVGAHGIMTLNDFKAIEGDRKLGVRSLPVQLGAGRAARLACLVMAAPQVVVILLLLHWDSPYYAIGVIGVLLAQYLLMPKLLSDPEKYAPWYNATGTSLYVSGMLVTAFALGAMRSAG